jgi:hypothetical protein
VHAGDRPERIAGDHLLDVEQGHLDRAMLGAKPRPVVGGRAHERQRGALRARPAVALSLLLVLTL